MTRLTFPFWIVLQRRNLLSKPVEPDGTPGFIAAFSTAEKAASFMVIRGETEWENRLISRSTLADLKADLGQLGFQGLCLDPTKGTCGTKVTSVEMEGA